jgi:hypothetical protein
MSADFGGTEGVTGFFWEPGTHVTLAVDNGYDGSIDYTSVATVDNLGDVRWDAGGKFSVGEGDLVTLTDDRNPPSVKSHVVQFFTLAEVSPEWDRLRGGGRWLTELFVRVRDPALPFPQGPTVVVEVGSSGTWTAGFTGLVDILADSCGWVQTSDDDGDHTQINFGMPCEPGTPSFYVSRDSNWIGGEDWPAGIDLAITADDPDTTNDPDIELALATDAEGRFSSDVQVFPGLEPGWVITVTDGMATKTHTVRDIAITGVDPTTEIMRGTADPFTTVYAHVDGGAAGYWVTADGTGQWSANFSGDYDITPGTRMRAMQMDEDRDHTFTDWIVPRPAGWQLNPVTGHYYLFVGDGMTWADAEAYAVSLGDHLVTINDTAEEAWLVARLGTQYWIGFNDIAVEGEWVWTSGERATYTNWFPGEPNNSDGTEDAAKIHNYPPVGWNDLTPGAADPDAFVVEHAPIGQTITFAALANRTIAESPFTVNATASSGLAVTFTTTTPKVCRTSGPNGQTITLVGAGTCTLRANQAGNLSYSPAPTVSRSFTVTRLSQTITFGALADRTFGESFMVFDSATASSGLYVTFTTTTPKVCRTSGPNGVLISLVGIGTCTLRADQAGDRYYDPAPSVSRSFTVTPCTGENCPPPPPRTSHKGE